jgi:DNA-directed RNA polymerase subunit RPC12/RpoP
MVLSYAQGVINRQKKEIEALKNIIFELTKEFKAGEEFYLCLACGKPVYLSTVIGGLCNPGFGGDEEWVIACPHCESTIEDSTIY